MSLARVVLVAVLILPSVARASDEVVTRPRSSPPSTRWLEVTVTEKRPNRPQTADYVLLPVTVDGERSSIEVRMGPSYYVVRARLDPARLPELMLELAVTRTPAAHPRNGALQDLAVDVRCALVPGEYTVVAKRHQGSDQATHVTATIR